MADWSESSPNNDTLYLETLQRLRDRDKDATGFNVNPTAPFTNYLRWVGVGGGMKAELWNGASWATKVLDVTGGGTGASDIAQAKVNLGIGTLGSQNANAVAITGGSISGTAIGATNNISADALTSGTIPGVRFPNPLPNLSAIQLYDIPANNLIGGMPAIPAAALTTLNASALTVGTVPTARLGSGSPNTNTFLRGDQTWATISAPASVPSGMIAIFEGSCPTGWTRVNAFDGRFLRGAGGYGATGGSDSHGHSFGATTDVKGAHRHDIIGDTETGGSIATGAELGQYTNVNFGTAINVSVSGHTHSVDVHAHHMDFDTNESGLHSHDLAGNTNGASSLPPYIDVVYCRKD